MHRRQKRRGIGYKICLDRDPIVRDVWNASFGIQLVKNVSYPCVSFHPNLFFIPLASGEKLHEKGCMAMRFVPLYIVGTYPSHRIESIGMSKGIRNDLCTILVRRLPCSFLLHVFSRKEGRKKEALYVSSVGIVSLEDPFLLGCNFRCCLGLGLE